MPLLVIMLDGVSADYFRTERGRLPVLSSLAARGLVVDRLHAAVLGTSFPGRASILTGAASTESGIYANKLWKGDGFYYANPDDVRVPTLPRLLLDAGREVATIGFGMVRPEDATLFKPPWWVGQLVMRSQGFQSTDKAWFRVFGAQDTGEQFNALCAAAQYPSYYPYIDPKGTTEKLMLGLMSEQRVANWTGIVAASDQAPDLVMTELFLPDTVQHERGYKTEESHFTIALIDQLVGVILERLRMRGKLDDWHICVLSDHGHYAVEQSIRPAAILPEGVQYQCEGSILLVHTTGVDVAAVTTLLAEYGVQPFDTDFMPDDARDALMAFVAPDRWTFENSVRDVEPVGSPRQTSSHSVRPGLPEDDRLCIFVGPGIVLGQMDEADAKQVAPTFAKLLGLNYDYPAQSII
jgi:predicted AlkP superfamily pyrophosphatase or phosphodiesterase